MQLGVSLKSAHRYPDPRRGAEVMVRKAIAAREAGLDSLFLGDHHGAGAGYLQNVPMLGRLLSEWPRRCGALFLLPLWPPLLVAEQVATLAAIAPGRFVLHTALGGGDAFRELGVELRSRISRFEAGLGIIRRLLAGEEVTADSPYRLAGTRISLLPPDPVEVWIGGHARGAIARAARLGEGWVVGPGLSVAELWDLLDYYHEQSRAAGRSPGRVAVRRDVYVGRDRADAERVIGPIVAAGYRGFEPGVLVYGGAEEVAGRLAELAGAGIEEVLVRHIGGDEGEVLASMERLGRVRELLAVS
jgi:alkanesulfonate monooxygenase SsuD/methylene tetrahydromethanopterin reductase-like flavin-dependent oxidoreductase (luciferase family)